MDSFFLLKSVRDLLNRAVGQFFREDRPRLGSHMQNAAFSTPIRVVSSALPNDSDAATAITIGRMEVLSGDAAPYLANIARSVCVGNVEQCAAAVHGYVRAAIRFVPDAGLGVLFGFASNADEAEILIRPDALLQMHEPRGDCDDFSMLCMSLFKAAGIPASFATVAADERIPDNFSHVYVVVHGPGGDIPVDASHGKHVGWAAPNQFGKLKVWKTGMYWNTLGGLSAGEGSSLDFSGWFDSLGGGSAAQTPTFTATGQAVKPSIWQDLLRQAGDTANYILKNRLTPPVLVRGADGSVTIRNPVGVDASTPYSSTAPQYKPAGTPPAADELPSWAIPAGVGVLALVVIMSMTKKK